MPCTTILVGKNASYDGSTLVARNEDSSNGVFEPKRMRVVHPDEQPRVYTSVLSHLTVELPDNPMRYTSVPDVVPGHVNLDAALQILYVAERSLTHHTFEHHAAGDGHFLPLPLLIMLLDVRAVCGNVVLRDLKRVPARCLKLRQLLPADL